MMYLMERASVHGNVMVALMRGDRDLQPNKYHPGLADQYQDYARAGGDSPCSWRIWAVGEMCDGNRAGSLIVRMESIMLYIISLIRLIIAPSRIILIGNVALESARGPISTVSESLAFAMTCHPWMDETTKQLRRRKGFRAWFLAELLRLEGAHSLKGMLCPSSLAVFLDHLPIDAHRILWPLHFFVNASEADAGLSSQGVVLVPVQ